MGYVKFSGVLALGVVFLSSRSSVTTNHMYAISSVCVHPAKPEVPSVTFTTSDCAIIEVICAVQSEVPLLCQMFLSSDVTLRCVPGYQHLSICIYVSTCIISV